MTKIFVFLTDSLSDSDFESMKKFLLRSSLSESTEAALRGKSERANRSSLAARALLFGAYCHLYGVPPRPLRKTKRGAPYFEGRARVSLSHTEGGVAVLLSDERRYAFGVDIEGGNVDPARAKRVEERFLKNLFPGPRFSGAELFLAKRIDGEALAFDFLPLPTIEPTDSFLARLTRSEAILKSTGRGFGAISHLSSLSRKTPTGTVEIAGENGTPFVLSYAKRGRFALPLLKKPWR